MVHAVGAPNTRLCLAVTALNKVLGAAGVVLLLAGALLGFHTVSASGTNCGSAFRPAGGITPMACDNALNGASTLTTIVIGAGVLCLIGAVAVKVLHDRGQEKAVA
ncbi:MAG: hypothetical protein HOV67_33460 [Kribbellaceae bacterium]|nr:hypothetical protein [Kribbellaceae bacterium]